VRWQKRVFGEVQQPVMPMALMDVKGITATR
jgi:hypothetical protein